MAEYDDIDKDIAELKAKREASAKKAEGPKRGVGGRVAHGLGVMTGFSAPENANEALQSLAFGTMMGAGTIGAAGRGVTMAARAARPLIGQTVERAAPIVGRILTSAGLESARAKAKGEDAGTAALLGGAGGGLGEAVNIYRMLRSAPVQKTLTSIVERMATPPGGQVDPRAVQWFRTNPWIEAPSLAPGKLTYTEALERLAQVPGARRSLGMAEVAEAIAKQGATRANPRPNEQVADLFLRTWADIQGSGALPAGLEASAGVARNLRPVSPTLQAVADSATSRGMADEPTRSAGVGAVTDTGAGIGGLLRQVPIVGRFIPGGH